MAWVPSWKTRSLAATVVMVVGRGDAHEVHLRVGQQVAVVVVALGDAECLYALLEARPVDVAGGNEVNGVLLLVAQAADDLHVGSRAAAGADESDAEPFAGAPSDAADAEGGNGCSALEEPPPRRTR